jgi:hypothetical protein
LAAGDAQSARFHYFLGSDVRAWRTSARSYGQLRYVDLWPGVDLVLRDGRGDLQYDLVLAPRARVEDIVVRCDGVGDVRIEPDGRLALSMAAGCVRQSVPVAWVEDGTGRRTSVACRFRRIDSRRYGFDAGVGEREGRLIIDPGIEWSTFLGGASYEYVARTVLDAGGQPVTAGYVASANFPTTAGSYDTTYNGRVDAFVSKLAADGKTLLWSTFIGGGSEDYATGLALTAAGEATITGSTLSSNFPVTAGAFQTTNNGGSGECFVARLSADGSRLVFATYLGAKAWDWASAVAVDGGGDAVVLGVTKSTDFPVTQGAYDTSLNGGGDGFVARLDRTGSTLSFATYLGSSGWDPLYDLVLDGAGNAFVVGDVFGVNNTSNFPTTAGAYDTTYNDTSDRSDTVVCKLSADGSKLLWSTWLGGNSWDPCYSIVLDADGNPTICGESWSTDFPFSTGAYQTTHKGDGDAYVAKLSADGSRLLLSTFLGGRREDRALAARLDPFGAIVVAGFTTLKYDSNPNDLPTTPGAFSSTFKGDTDAFVARLSPDGRRLWYSTLVNGSEGDRVYAMALDARGAAVIAGDCFGADFPTTTGAYDTTYNGLGDAFVALAEALPLGTTRFGSWSPACAASAPLGITVEPRENTADFAFLGAGAPPSTVGVLLIGAGRFPSAVPILGAGIFVDLTKPTLLLTAVSGADGRSAVPLPLGSGLVGLRLYNQLVWLNTPACGGRGRLSASNAIDLTVK